ncbi:unnamed protein product [Gadus morhua 'NCC']
MGKFSSNHKDAVETSRGDGWCEATSSVPESCVRDKLPASLSERGGIHRKDPPGRLCKPSAGKLKASSQQEARGGWVTMSSTEQVVLR